MLLVTVNNVAMIICVQVFVDLFFVVSEKLTFVKWEEGREADYGFCNRSSLIVEVASLGLVSSSALLAIREESCDGTPATSKGSARKTLRSLPSAEFCDS